VAGPKEKTVQMIHSIAVIAGTARIAVIKLNFGNFGNFGDYGDFGDAAAAAAAVSGSASATGSGCFLVSPMARATTRAELSSGRPSDGL
jgi:hypothetical protein